MDPEAVNQIVKAITSLHDGRTWRPETIVTAFAAVVAACAAIVTYKLGKRQIDAAKANAEIQTASAQKIAEDQIKAAEENARRQVKAAQDTADLQIASAQAVAQKQVESAERIGAGGRATEPDLAHARGVDRTATRQDRRTDVSLCDRPLQP